tara:strand:+ start:437 stop:1543 length:1107 start_codon:yes stop_codon:yes gene_type:complete
MKKSNVAVVGCGIFGAMTAIRLAESGLKVTIYDSSQMALQGASLNNQNRLHLGFHYPRDDETAAQCIKGFEAFKSEFPECILDNFENAYFIASKGSLTSPEEYLKFCERLKLNFKIIDPKKFDPLVQNVDLGIVCDEVVYDSKILETIISKKFKTLDIIPKFNSEITNISKMNAAYSLEVNGNNNEVFDAVINCTYANLNQLNSQVGSKVKELQYEYTMVPIVDWSRPPVGITVMDGPFMTVLPFGKSGDFLLYHVNHTVIDRSICTEMPREWKHSETSPARHENKQAIFRNILHSFEEFVPSVINSHLKGFLQTTRVVLPNKEKTDARPSIINEIDKGFLSVFTAKIDHCMWVSKEISLRINNYLGY